MAAVPVLRARRTVSCGVGRVWSFLASEQILPDEKWCPVLATIKISLVTLGPLDIHLFFMYH